MFPATFVEPVLLFCTGEPAVREGDTTGMRLGVVVLEGSLCMPSHAVTVPIESVAVPDEVVERHCVEKEYEVAGGAGGRRSYEIELCLRLAHPRSDTSSGWRYSAPDKRHPDGAVEWHLRACDGQ